MTSDNSKAVASDALFGIQFGTGQVLFDIWPGDLTKTIGRMAVLPWKSCYTEQGVQDSISCGVIVGVHDDWIRVEHKGGFYETAIANAFLVPNPAVRGCESTSVPCTGVVLPSDSVNQRERK